MVRPVKFEITQRGDQSMVTLAVVGELDMSTVPQLAESVGRRVSGGARDVTVDLHELSFMDSSGLRLLIELYDTSREGDWTLRLIAPRHEAALLVLRVTGADQALPFKDARKQ